MAYTRNWDESQPQDHTKLSDVPSWMRAIKIDVAQRLKDWIYGFISGETKIGLKKAPLHPVSSDPATESDKGILYVKEVDGIKELFYKDSGGNVKQLTVEGKLNIESNEAVLLTGDQTIHGIKKFMDKVGIGTDSPEVELDVDGYIFGAGKRRYAKTISVESDGDILLAYGARINGIWHLRFEGPSRMHHFSFTISADNSSGDNVKIHVIKNWCYGGQEVFGKPFVKYRTDGTVPHLYIPISNRNGGTTLDVVFEETAPFAATFMPSSTYNGETLDSTKHEATGVWETTGTDLYFGSYSKSTNGYTKLPNGLILQWVSVDWDPSGNSVTQSFSFPISFPNACLQVVLSSNEGKHDSGSNSIEGAKISSFDKNSFTIESNWVDGVFQTWRIIAIGY